MNDDLRAALDALLAERYAPPMWWKAPPAVDEGDDDLTTARRRRLLAADFDRSYREDTA